MSSILTNSATIMIAVLLVLAIAYRYYSAFIAAKVLALDPARPTPAHTLTDGQNYHPTNKWVLFGHHFAAISGAGPLIGPVLAAQFGFMPGLLWILVGVCLAGAVQDFIVLVLSIRRNGRSLAQIAYMEIGTASGTAAIIGILFVLVIALAGLGKVVTKALGGETVTYAAGTQFVARDDGPIINNGQSGTVYRYHVPAGTHVIYPGGVGKDASSAIELRATASAGAAVDIEDPTLPPGSKLRVLRGSQVDSVAAGGTGGTGGGTSVNYPAGTEFLAPDGRTIAMRLEQNVYHYVLPAGTRITLRDQLNKPIVTQSEMEITARAGDLGPGRGPTRTLMRVPLGGSIVTRANDARTVYPAGTEFNAEGRPITVLQSTDNLQHYRVPQGTRIIDPSERTTTVPAEFELVVRPVDLMVTSEAGHRLVVPANIKVDEEIAGSSWGTFTLALTIPIAFLIGIYMYRIRKGKVLEASIIGGVLTLLAVYLGGVMSTDGSYLSLYRDWFNLSGKTVGVSMAVYGFVAAILPVWMLLCPRDYLSSFLKIGTVILLVLGVIVAHPAMHAPAFNTVFMSEGPVLAKAPIFPFLFITIMCGAVSGFHSLVSSGTTPKMINKETDARTIGYGAMLMEGLVGIVALIAASALPVGQYYDINTPPDKIPLYQTQIDAMRQGDRAAALDEELPDVGEHVQGRTGGAVTLAMGMAYILNGAVHNIIGHPDKPPAWLADLFKYWYHFAIMFEALFILTTIDTGTRVGRFLLQETMGKWITPKLGQTDWWPSVVLSTALITVGWWYFLDANAFAAIWAMFGIANQMLAVMALAVASAALSRNGKRKYLWVTLAPMCFVTVTTASAAVLKLIDYWKAIAAYQAPAPFPINPLISFGCVLAILTCTGVVMAGAIWTIMSRSEAVVEAEPAATVVTRAG